MDTSTTQPQFAYPRWELRRLSEQLPYSALQVGRVQVGPSGTTTFDSPGRWWRDRDSFVFEILDRVIANQLPPYPNAATELDESQRLACARFGLLLAATVIREHETGDDASRSSPSGDWQDPAVARDLGSRLGTLADSAWIPRELSSLIDAVTSGDLSATERGPAGGELEAEVMAHAGFYWLEAAVKSAGLTRPCWAEKPGQIEPGVELLVRRAFSGVHYSQAERHQLLGTFSTESDTGYNRAVLRAQLHHEAQAVEHEQANRFFGALLGLAMLTLADGESRWTSRLPEQLRLAATHSDLASCRELAETLLRFPDTAGSTEVRREFWEVHDALVNEAAQPEQSVASQEPTNSIVRRGPIVQVTFGREVFPAKEAVGWWPLSRLLENPDRAMRPEELLERPATGASRGMEALDGRAIREIKDEIERLGHSSDPSDIAERMELEDRLRRDRGIGGKPRKLGDGLTKNRAKARQQIRRLMDALSVHGVLYEHLKEHVSTKNFEYAPPPGTPAWSIDI